MVVKVSVIRSLMPTKNSTRSADEQRSDHSPYLARKLIHFLR
jgi:hypothetical protein